MKISKKRIFILIIFMIFILLETVSFAAYQAIEETKKEEIIVGEIASLNEEEEKTLELINEYREQNGLNKLKAISNLQEVANLKANDLVENEYFSHTSEILGTPFEMIKANGIKYRVAGENLAGNISPEKAVEAWINSDLHRENILDEDFEYTGIAVIDSEIYGKVFVQLFMGV